MSITFTLIAQAIVFALFIWFTAKFVWPPLMRAVEARQRTIADGLAAAEKGNRSLAEAAAKTDEQLKAARAQAQEILAAANKQAGQLVDQAKGRNIGTIAERVEDANTMAVLWQLGIEFIQGYFVNEPEQVVMG